MDDNYSIELCGLTKRYGTFTALDNLNMVVKQGEFMGLLGPNGAGKSTTLKMVTGLVKPSSGNVLINSKDIIDSKKKALNDVGCVVETPEYYPKTTPRDILKYVGKIKGLSDAEIDIRSKDVLELLRIYDRRDNNVNAFSKGMRQRVALAQALLSNPSVLILDEPTTGLDPRGMIELREILLSLKKTNVSMLLSTHNLTEISEICESVTMLRDGRTVLSGNVSELIKKDASNTKTILIKTMDVMNEEFISRLLKMDGVKEVNQVSDCELSLIFTGNEEAQSNIVSLILQSNLKLVSMNEETGSSLEKLYMEMSIDTGESR